MLKRVQHDGGGKPVLPTSSVIPDLIRDPEHQKLRLRLWIPALAGMTTPESSYGTSTVSRASASVSG
jgi:hypothetical protein